MSFINASIASIALIRISGQRLNFIWKPRLSMKKLLLLCLLAVGGLLLVMHNQWTQSSNMGDQEPKQKLNRIIKSLKNQTLKGINRSHLTTKVANIQHSTERTFPFLSPPSKTRGPMSLTRASVMDPNNLQIPEESMRPWYMAGGYLCPENSVLNTSTGVKNVKIFPDELPGEDRIPGTKYILPPVWGK